MDRIKGRFRFLSIIMIFSFLFPNLLFPQNNTPFEKELELSKMLVEERGNEFSQFPLHIPSDIAFDSKGNIYVLDSGNQCIVKYSSNGKYLMHWGNNGIGPGEFSITWEDPLFISEKDEIYIFNSKSSLINIFTTDGVLTASFRTERPVFSLIVDIKGFIYTTCAGSVKNDSLIHVYNSKGKKVAEYGEPFFLDNSGYWNKSYIAFDKENNLYMVFGFFPFLRKYNSDGKLIFEKRINLLSLKIGPKWASYWNSVDEKHLPLVDGKPNTSQTFSTKIVIVENDIYVELGNQILLLNKDSILKGFYYIGIELGRIITPLSVIIDPESKQFLRPIKGKEIIGVGVFNIQ